MRRKRIMVIGPTGCGKTSLVNALNKYEGPLRRTQNLIYGENTIDVPGSYIENAWMYKHLISAAQDASHVLILVDPTDAGDVYSPGFAKTFRCPVIGVITKCDLQPSNEDAAVKKLKRLGIEEPYYRISVPDGTGMAALKERLLKKEPEKRLERIKGDQR